MNSTKDDEDFWYSSEKRSFCFENNEQVDALFGVTKNDTEKLWAGISNAPTSDTSLKFNDEIQNLKPILSVISEKTLSSILAADKIQNLPIETAGLQPDITLRKILLGKAYSLEPYKSFISKTKLLDAAILSGDGNAILIIILFLIKTLKRQLVQKLLMERPAAAHIYIHYLSIRMQIHDITDILTMLGKSTDAAMKSLHLLINNTRDPERLLQKLKNCYKTQFSSLPDCKEGLFVQHYIKLLEWQAAARLTENGRSLEINSSVLESLSLTCKEFWDSGESAFSPTALSQQHEIPPVQYQKVALTVRASVSAWDDIDRILLTKGWLGTKKKLQTNLPIEKILDVLHKSHAPLNILEKYLKYVDNSEDRLELAKKLSCCRAVIDIFVLQGDRTALLEYKSKLEPQSEDYFYAESALRQPSIKWKA
ncbi:spermatogenesis-defective protein 39 homolog [Prorops nasuta]|uniref:spermatogenesis-defective protein 39 homolog n=1 Tax=Prorops nasuta TaxID=863751 RepID=UPI0034CF2B17